MSEWQPIETAPKDGTLVDLWIQWRDGGPWREADCTWVHGAWWTAGREAPAEGETYKATHWMPIPDGPTG